MNTKTLKTQLSKWIEQCEHSEVSRVLVPPIGTTLAAHKVQKALEVLQKAGDPQPWCLVLTPLQICAVRGHPDRIKILENFRNFAMMCQDVVPPEARFIKALGQ